MTNNKQTAVEWLVKQIENHIHHTIRIPSEYVEQAKEMEKQQIIELKIETLIAYGVPEESAKKFAEQYYKETYEKNTNN